MKISFGKWHGITEITGTISAKYQKGAIRKGFTDASSYGYQFTLSQAISLGKRYVNAIPDPDTAEEPKEEDK